MSENAFMRQRFRYENRSGNMIPVLSYVRYRRGYSVSPTFLLSAARTAFPNYTVCRQALAV